MKPEATRQSVVIGICTFRRPQGLEAVLDAVVRQKFRKAPAPRLQIMVIDNDADPAVEQYLNDFAGKHAVSARYLAEPRRGISQARNCFLGNIPESADLVAFLDDDEVPTEYWLDELMHGLLQSGADAISGPVLPEYDRPPPRWLSDGKFFTAPRRKNPGDYEPVRFGVMGNFLMRRQLLENKKLYFPEELGLVGSEDSHFFAELNAMNAKMSWAGNAVAAHKVPAARVSLAYLLSREFRVGCGKTLVLRLSGAKPSRLFRQGLSDFSRLLIKLVVLVPACLAGFTRSNHYERVKPIFDVWQFAGRLYGLLGLRYQQYR